MSKEIFISHAVKDKALADAFVDLMVTAMGISADDIFCSSLEGMGIPSGADFVDHIKAAIQSPKAVVALITPNYLASQFCLCELGATWAMYHSLFPLLVKPLTFEDVKGVLTGAQLTEINSATRLSELRDQLNSTLGLTGKNTARWESKRDVFLKGLPKILKKLPSHQQVSAAAHAKVVSDLDDARQYIADQEADLEEKKDLITKLEKAKDKNEVAAIKRAYAVEADQLDQLETDLGLQLENLPKHVSYVACKEIGLQQRVKIDNFKDADLAEGLERAAGQQLIEIDDSGFCTLNSSHPLVKKMFKPLRVLKKFIDTASSETHEDFETEHETTLSLGNSDYWAIRLDNRLHRMSF
ncbi:toll/interleukin-1 receptor domain-containing protein [Pseudomonas sp. NPDC078416]|uniref:toll/interleukin-1 receptor domain-containing protein n=1 Tax=Pseudomonas sp. NPDC078416 TaxID=3390637 RepID=UPI003CFFA4FB